MPYPLTVVIPTLNEEKNILRAINSVKGIASEILVIDSGSTDRTVEIAKNLGAKVIFNKWVNYPTQVQFGIDKASYPYVFVIDADEEVSKELRKSIEKLFKTEEIKKYACFQVNRKTFYIGKFLNFTWQPEYRTRIFHKDKVKYEGYLHEIVICKGETKKIEGYLYHYTYKDIEDHFQRALKYSKISAVEMHKRGKRFKLYKLLFNPIWAFSKQYFFHLGFLDGIRGLSVAMSYLISTFLKYLYLWELEEQEKKNEKG